MPLHSVSLRDKLELLFDQAAPALLRTDWRLCGTAAALLYGADLPTADIDLLFRDRTGIDAVAAALNSAFICLTAPHWMEAGRQYFAVFDLDGTQLELSTVEWETDSDSVETIGEGPWRYFQLLPCGAHQVPVVAMELRLGTELSRGRRDRSEPIITWLA